MRRAERLLELQKTDLALDAARRRVREIEAQLSESDALRAAREADRRLHERLIELRTRSKDLELQSQTNDDKIESVEHRLYSGAVKNPKELSDLQRDAASLRRHKATLDDRLLQLILDIEQIESERDAAQTELARVDAAWRSDQADLLQERQCLSEQIAGLETQRAEQRARIEPQDLGRYDQLRKQKHGQAAALVEDGSCSACGVQPSANKLAHLRRDDELLACGNCERILVVPS